LDWLTVDVLSPTFVEALSYFIILVHFFIYFLYQIYILGTLSIYFRI